MNPRDQIATLNLGGRAVNALTKLGVRTAEEISWLTPAELLRQPNVGRETFYKIEKAIKPLRLDFERHSYWNNSDLTTFINKRRDAA